MERSESKPKFRDLPSPPQNIIWLQSHEKNQGK